jgi:predicted amidohydrolase
MRLRAAGLQMDVSQDIARNQGRILAALTEAAGMGADFLVTPEGSLSGYHSRFEQPELAAALNEVVTRAAHLKIGLMLGTCFKNEDGSCQNQVRIYSPDGGFLGAHSKILVCSPGEMLEYRPGDLHVFEWKGARFGVLVCNDLWASPGYTTIPNPYLALKLKEMGAQWIVHSINSGSRQDYRKFHESSAELWAQNLNIPIMEVNAAQGKEKINASSGLIDSLGLRAQAVPDSGEHLFYCEISPATSAP